MNETMSPQELLETLLEKLSEVFSDLHIVLDTSVVCHAAAEGAAAECKSELAAVIHQSITHGIEEQMHALTECIEMLGGTTCYSDDDEDADDEEDDDE